MTYFFFLHQDNVVHVVTRKAAKHGPDNRALFFTPQLPGHRGKTTGDGPEAPAAARANGSSIIIHLEVQHNL